MIRFYESLAAGGARIAGPAMRACGLAVPALCLAISPVSAASTQTLKPQVTSEQTPAGFQVKSRALALQPISLDVSRFAFTAPGRVPSSQVQTVEREFRFTPSRSGNRGVSLGMTARNIAPKASTATAAARAIAADQALTPRGYDVDVSVAYRGFSVSGGVSRMDTGIGGRSTEGVDVGLGYAARNWRTGIVASAAREEQDLLPTGVLPDPRYAVEASGALTLSPQISVGGSVRYRMAPQNLTPLDPNKDDRAVFLGGSVAF